MDTFMRFVYEFLAHFFGAFWLIIKAIGGAIAQIFDFRGYLKILNFYKDDFNGPEWLFVGFAVILMLVIVVGLALSLLFWSSQILATGISLDKLLIVLTIVVAVGYVAS